jgi:tetraacyldisaccharide 4'-kinase
LQRQWWIAPPTLAARALRPLAALFGGLAALHRAVTRPRRLAVPVVVVGNLIVGGAGKTPTTITVVRMLRALGWQPGVVSRGHGRHSHGLYEVQPDSLAPDCGDEPLLIRRRTGVPVMVGSDRVAAACALCTAHPEIDILVADDGLQHHRLARDLQIIVFDERGVGNGLLLPAGPLRQRLPRTCPADTIVLYNAQSPTTRLPGRTALRRHPGVLSLADWWQGLTPPPDSWQGLQDRPLLAVAGVAAPERFFDMLREKGLTLYATRALPDHDPYAVLPWRQDTPDVVITEKDAVKLTPAYTLTAGATPRVWVVPLDLEPDLAFAAAIERHFPNPPNNKPP